MSEPVLEVRGLETWIVGRGGTGKAVDKVSFQLQAGETLGLVGESGSGKSLTCLSLLRLNPRPASRIVGGEVLLHGENLLEMSEREMRTVRGRRIAMVLQDPMTALNPVYTVGNQVAEPLRLHRGLRGPGAVRNAVAAMLARLRIAEPERRAASYPHHFSGGMRQRVVGAIALAGGPEILIADEPTTALDVTIQAAYLDLLKEIQAEEGLSILFVTHDFAVVSRMCDRVAVMYAGRIVETAPTDALFADPKHPYTQALLRSVPDVDERPARLQAIDGQPPSVFAPAPGCAFAPRCAYADDTCRAATPPDVVLGPDRAVACWRHAP
jgi:oligopeptide/dipeptide ABC transporter ATP-binding protein